MTGDVFITLGQGAELGIVERCDNTLLLLRQPHPEHPRSVVETDFGPATTKRMDDLINCIQRLKVHAVED